jgi:poly(hydroxyalkanoate) granule-associated protein
LGAFAKAQEEGNKVFENLVKEGSHLQQATQQAQAKMTEAAEKVGQMATGHMDKLETIFEERVAKALKHMGLPSAQDLADLQARVEELEKQLAERKS